MESKLNTFEELQGHGIIEERFDFWTDFRWSSQQVKQKADLLIKKYPDIRENKLKNDNPVEIIWAILEKAIWTGQGLIAYSD